MNNTKVYTSHRVHEYICDFCSQPVLKTNGLITYDCDYHKDGTKTYNKIFVCHKGDCDRQLGRLHASRELTEPHNDLLDIIREQNTTPKDQ